MVAVRNGSFHHLFGRQEGLDRAIRLAAGAIRQRPAHASESSDPPREAAEPGEQGDDLPHRQHPRHRLSRRRRGIGRGRLLHPAGRRRRRLHAGSRRPARHPLDRTAGRRPAHRSRSALDPSARICPPFHASDLSGHLSRLVRRSLRGALRDHRPQSGRKLSRRQSAATSRRANLSASRRSVEGAVRPERQARLPPEHSILWLWMAAYPLSQLRAQEGRATALLSQGARPRGRRTDRSAQRFRRPGSAREGGSRLQIRGAKRQVPGLRRQAEQLRLAGHRLAPPDRGRGGGDGRVYPVPARGDQEAGARCRR